MSYSKVTIDKMEYTAVIRLNHPRKYNAIDRELASELAEITTEIRRDSTIRAVVLTGAGDNFCSGGDLQQLQSLTLKRGNAMLASIHTFILNLVGMEKPVVAAINGAAAGLGFSLALAADLLIAGESAKFSQGYVKIGLAPDGGATWLLHQGANCDLKSLLAYENDVQQKLIQTDDFKEGTQAFLEKRKPNFYGR
jgi:2-(1,2-epoxy-1,2-dihydrophenyl)acetyl-CoA isomerase